MTSETDLSAQSTPGETLFESWQALCAAEPGLRIRDAARRLGVAELELLLTRPPQRACRLEPDFAELYRWLPGVGEIMTLARNEEVVHETTGRMGPFNVARRHGVGLCLGAIDLRVFFSQWAHGYAVVEDTRSGERHSLQFFDASGTAIHKVYATARTDAGAWAELIDAWRARDQHPAIELTSPDRPARDGEGVDPEELARDWAAITDVHQFNGMLRRHGLDRLTALEMVDDAWARRIPAGSFEWALTAAAEREVPVMVFVGNRGIVQIFTGPVQRLVRLRDWFNVLDPGFSLHARSDRFASEWLVRRPSEDGVITSIDCFNADGELVVSVFGERKPGRAERGDWRELIDGVPA